VRPLVYFIHKFWLKTGQVVRKLCWLQFAVCSWEHYAMLWYNVTFRSCYGTSRKAQETHK